MNKRLIIILSAIVVFSIIVVCVYLYNTLRWKPPYPITDDTVLLPMVFDNYKMGYIDENGNKMIRPKFPRARHFSEGLAAVYQPDIASRNIVDFYGQNGLRSGLVFVSQEYNSSDLFLVDYVYHENEDDHFHRVRRMTNLGGLMECQISDFISPPFLHQ